MVYTDNLGRDCRVLELRCDTNGIGSDAHGVRSDNHNVLGVRGTFVTFDSRLSIGPSADIHNGMISLNTVMYISRWSNFVTDFNGRIVKLSAFRSFFLLQIFYKK